MITTMPRPRPPFLSREVTRHGRPVWYVRRDGKRIRLRAEYGTPEFEAEYQAACNGIRPQKAEEAAGARHSRPFISCKRCEVYSAGRSSLS